MFLVSAIFGAVWYKRYRTQGKSTIFFAILASSCYDYTKIDTNSPRVKLCTRKYLIAQHEQHRYVLFQANSPVHQEKGIKYRPL